MLLNTFKTIKQTQVFNELRCSIDFWLNEIQTGKRYSNVIQNIRNLKGTLRLVNSKDNVPLSEIHIKDIKNQIRTLKSTLPCIVWPYQLIINRNDDHITQPTGYMYIDIDTDFNTTIIDPQYIRALYKSCGGSGYGLIVKVDGLNSHNYKNAYQYVVKLLNIQSLVDLNAAKKTQPNILSFDPEMINNDKSSVITIPTGLEGTLRLVNSKDNVPLSESINIFDIPLDNLISELKKDNAKLNIKTVLPIEQFKGEEVLKFEIPYKSCSYFIKPKSISEGNRNRVMTLMASNIIFNNPTANEEDVIKLLSSFNRGFNPPLTVGELKSIISSIFKRKHNGTLERSLQYMITDKYIAFKPGSTLTKSEKLSISSKWTAERRRKKRLSALQTAIDNWDINIPLTQKNLSNEVGMHLNSIKTYWKELNINK